jgi:hypothetical protein
MDPIRIVRLFRLTSTIHVRSQNAKRTLKQINTAVATSMCTSTVETVSSMSNEDIMRNIAMSQLLRRFGETSEDVASANADQQGARASRPTVPPQYVPAQTDPLQFGYTAPSPVSLETPVRVTHASTEEETSMEDNTSSGRQEGRVGATRPRRRRQGRAATNPEENSHPHQLTVQHHYHDFSTIPPVETGGDGQLKSTKGKGGIAFPFPSVLHAMLEQTDKEGFSDVVSWQPHGRAFTVHSQTRFVKEVMPLFFRQTRFASFQRQLSLYGFLRLTRRGPDHGAYYHELFIRGRPDMCHLMQRTRVKGSGVRQSSSPETEPNFALMPPLPNVLVSNNNDYKATPAHGDGNSGKIQVSRQLDGNIEARMGPHANYNFGVPPTSFNPMAVAGFGLTNPSLLSVGSESMSNSGRTSLVEPLRLPSASSRRTSLVAAPAPLNPEHLSFPMHQFFEPPIGEQTTLAAFLSDVGLESDDELDVEPLPWNAPSRRADV